MNYFCSSVDPFLLTGSRDVDRGALMHYGQRAAIIYVPWCSAPCTGRWKSPSHPYPTPTERVHTCPCTPAHAHSKHTHTDTYQARPHTHTHTSVCPKTHRRCSVPLLAPLRACAFTWKTRKSHISRAINITTETSSYRRNYSRSQSGTTKTSTKAKITLRSRRAAFAALSPRNAR